MNTIQVAHVKVQGSDFVFVPLSSQFKQVAPDVKQTLLKQIREICRSAGLGGEVVVAWPSETGISYLADSRYHAVLSKTLTVASLRGSLNKKLSSPIITGLLAQLTADPFAANVPPPSFGGAADVRAPAQDAGGDAGHRSMPGMHSESKSSSATRVVTMLFTDLVGSTKLKQEFGDSQAMQYMREHHEIVRRVLAGTATGEEVSTSGDSFFIAFATPSEAVTFALKMQHEVERRFSEEGVNIQDRVGIHVGEVYVDNAKVAGKTFDFNGIQVDTASRIMSLAQGKQILMSRFAYDNAFQMLNGHDVENVDLIAWRNHGSYEVKGVKAPVEIFEVGEVGLAPLKPPPDSEKAKRLVVATR
jgi:class 3 adenylate cyclase